MPKLKNYEGALSAANNIGNVLSQQHNANGAIKYYRISLAYSKKAKNNKGIADALLNIGSANFDSNRNDSALIYFNQAKPINQIILSVMQNSGAFVLPPEKIIIKGGDSPAHAKVIGTLNIGIPKKDPEVNINVPLAISIIKGNYRYIEIEADNITKLPNWHNGKGQKGWVFLDEVFFY